MNERGWGYRNLVIQLGDVRSRMKGRCGRKKTYREMIFDLVRKLPFQHRGCLREITARTGICKDTLQRVLKHATIRVKPLLSDAHKKAIRLMICYLHVDGTISLI
jgi:hypothetical protein